MNIFNRIVMVLGLLALLVLAAVLLWDPVYMVGVARANLDFFEQLLYQDQSYYAILGVLIGIVVLCLILLFLELRRSRKKTVRIRAAGAGKAQLGIESVAQSLQFRIDELAGVREVHPKVISRGKDVKVIIDLDTSPSVNIPVLTEQIIDLCHDIIEGQLGVKIHGKVQVNVHHQPYPRGTLPPTEPLPRTGRAIATQPQILETEQRPIEKASYEPSPIRTQPEPATTPLESEPTMAEYESPFPEEPETTDEEAAGASSPNEGPTS